MRKTSKQQQLVVVVIKEQRYERRSWLGARRGKGWNRYIKRRQSAGTASVRRRRKAGYSDSFSVWTLFILGSPIITASWW